METASELQRVTSHNMGQAVAPAPGVIHLALTGYVDADGEIVEGHVLDTLDALVQRNNAQRSLARNKSLRGQGWPHTAGGLADDVGKAHVAEVRFIDGVRAKSLHVAKAEQLRAAVRQRVEAGNTGSALLGRIRIVHGERS